MNTIPLTPETVKMYKDILTEPEKNKLPYKPITDCFKKSETVTAQHVLFNEYIAYIENRPLPKVIFYIIMQEIFGNCNGKDESGCAGWFLKFDAN